MIKEGKFTLLEKRGALAKITINRPDKRNALSRDTIREILALFEELRKDDSIAVVLTTGAGDVAYCAGRDLSEFPTEGGKNRGSDRRAEPRAYHVAEVIRTFPKVTIAVVNGFCLGAGSHCSCPTILRSRPIERNSVCLRSSADSCRIRLSRRCLRRSFRRNWHSN